MGVWPELFDIKSQCNGFKSTRFEQGKIGLVKIFERNNIKKINCLKEKFDPNSHQAMLEVIDESVEPGTVVQEIQPGYMFGERLLRPSLVGISKKKGSDIKEKDIKK